MTGRELKALVEQIPDEAEVVVAGSDVEGRDPGFADWVFKKSALVEWDPMVGCYTLQGFGEDA